MEKMEPSGLYIISDQYFTDFPNERYMKNTSSVPTQSVVSHM